MGGVSEKWWNSWWEQDYSWEGLAAKLWNGWIVLLNEQGEDAGSPIPMPSQIEQSYRNASLQDYWSSAGVTEHDLITMPGNPEKQFTHFHLPLNWPDGQPARENISPSKAESFAKLLRSELGRTNEFTKFGHFGSPISADHRLQWQGTILPGLNLKELFENDTKKQDRFRISLRCDGAAFIGPVDLQDVTFLSEANFSNTVFFRATNFLNARFLGPANFHKAIFEGLGNFNRVSFLQSATFSDTDFRANAEFLEVYVAKSADFQNASFSRNANFSNSEFEGFTSFSKTNFHWTAEFKAAKFRDSANFGSSNFLKTANFLGTEFAKSAIFRHVIFSGDARFQSVKINGFANFEFSKFSGDAYFSDARFADYANFESAHFSKEALFKNSTFSGYAYFGKVKFTGKAQFGDSLFSDNAVFNNVAFSSAAEFFNTKFGNESYFKSATFSDYAGFENAEIRRFANFERATFKKHARFHGTGFCGYANFLGVQFSDQAEFKEATFSDIASFNVVEFIHGANFDGTVFSRDAYFKSAAFLNNASFQNCVFAEDLNCFSTAFSGDANFKESTFVGPAIFSGLGQSVFSDSTEAELSLGKFDGEGPVAGTLESKSGPLWTSQRSMLQANFSNAIFFGHAAFDNRDICNYGEFDGTEFFRAAGFQNSNQYRGISFTRANFERALSPMSRSHSALETETLHRIFQSTSRNENCEVGLQFGQWQKEFEKKIKLENRQASKDEGRYFESVEDGFRSLKQIMEQRRDRSAESRFFKLELKARRKRRDKHVPWWETAVSWSFELMSDFGTSVFRPIVWLLASSVAFAIIYQVIGGGVFETNDTLDTLRFSFSRVFPFGPWAEVDKHSTIGLLLTPHDDAIGIGLHAHPPGTDILVSIFAVLQSFLSAILVFLSALAVRRRFQIN